MLFEDLVKKEIKKNKFEIDYSRYFIVLNSKTNLFFKQHPWLLYLYHEYKKPRFRLKRYMNDNYHSVEVEDTEYFNGLYNRFKPIKPELIVPSKEELKYV